jgi:hypothetical protein
MLAVIAAKRKAEDSVMSEPAHLETDFMYEIVRLLPLTERLALYHWYVLRQPEAHLCAHLSLDAKGFQRLRQDLRSLWSRKVAERRKHVPVGKQGWCSGEARRQMSSAESV